MRKIRREVISGFMRVHKYTEYVNIYILDVYEGYRVDFSRYTHLSMLGGIPRNRHTVYSYGVSFILCYSNGILIVIW